MILNSKKLKKAASFKRQASSKKGLDKGIMKDYIGDSLNSDLSTFQNAKVICCTATEIWGQVHLLKSGLRISWGLLGHLKL